MIKKLWKENRRFIQIWIVIYILVFLFAKIIFFFAIIPSESMYPTLKKGNIVIGERQYQDIERYDIVIYKREGFYYIKRVIGIPGDHLVLDGENAYANGNKLKNDFVQNSSLDTGTYEVPDSCYFVMGDNRTNSRDSRVWDDPYVHADEIVAVAKIVLNSFTQL